MQGGDDDGRALVDGIAQLGGILADGADKAVRLFELEDGVPQLPVQHAAVRDHDDGLEYLAFLRVMQAAEAVGQPGYGIGFAAARAVLDQVLLPRAVCADVVQQLVQHVPLVIAREDEAFPDRDLAGGGVFFFGLFQMQELVQKLLQGIPAQHPLPQVGRGVAAVRGRRVARAAHFARAVAALVEGQEKGLLPLQAGGHFDVEGVHGKAGEHAALEVEKQVVRRAVLPELAHGVLHGLAGERVFQLQADDGDAVEQQGHVHAVLVGRAVAQLARAVQDIALVALHAFGVEAGLRLPEDHAEARAQHGKAVAQHVQQGAAAHLLAKAVHKALFRLAGVLELVHLPGFGLAGTHKVQQGLHVQGPRAVKARRVARPVAAVGAEPGADIVLEVAFLHLFQHEGTSRLPVTHSKIRLFLYSASLSSRACFSSSRASIRAHFLSR